MTSSQESKKYDTLKEFWPFYLGEHADATNRTLHFIGSAIGLVWATLAIVWRNPWLVIPALLSGYAFAWIGHFFVEKNKPASFSYPLKSFLCDWIMFFYILTGQINKEIARLKEAGLWHPSAPPKEALLESAEHTNG